MEKEILEKLDEVIKLLKEQVETSKRLEKLFSKYDQEYMTLVSEDGHQVE